MSTIATVVIFAVLAACSVPLAVRAMATKRLVHLTDREQSTASVIALAALGLVFLSTAIAADSPLVGFCLMGLVSFLGMRVSGRLHMTTPSRARLTFGKTVGGANLACAGDRSLHPLSRSVSTFLDAEGRHTPDRTMSRSQLRSLPNLLDAELRTTVLDRAGRRDAVRELKRFLRKARGCGCLVLEPIPTEEAPLDTSTDLAA